MAETSSISLSLRNAVKDALQKEAGAAHLDLPDYITRLLEDHVIARSLLDDEAKHDIMLTRSLVDRAVAEANRLVATGGFRASITFDAIQSVCADPDWLADYRTLVRDDPYKTGNPRKQTVNQNMGYFIKKSLGARSMTKPDGRPMNAKVTGAIIQSYTPLAR